MNGCELYGTHVGLILRENFARRVESYHENGHVQYANYYKKDNPYQFYLYREFSDKGYLITERNYE